MLTVLVASKITGNQGFFDYKTTYKFVIENNRIGWYVKNNWPHKLHKLPSNHSYLVASH